MNEDFGTFAARQTSTQTHSGTRTCLPLRPALSGAVSHFIGRGDGRMGGGGAGGRGVVVKRVRSGSARAECRWPAEMKKETRKGLNTPEGGCE